MVVEARPELGEKLSGLKKNAKDLARAAAKGCDEELVAKSEMCMYVCACGEVRWRLDALDGGSAMELRLGMAGWCYDVTVGGRVLIWRCRCRWELWNRWTGTDCVALSYNVTWTWTCTRSNRDWMLEVRVC